MNMIKFTYLILSDSYIVIGFLVFLIMQMYVQYSVDILIQAGSVERRNLNMIKETDNVYML